MQLNRSDAAESWRIIVQTIKTAAIVIFMGTVMYGAWTSITTPPDRLPDEVHELLFDHEPAIAFDEQSFDAGLADAIPDLDINIGQPSPDAGMNGESVASLSTNTENDSAQAESNVIRQSDSDQSVTESAMDSAVTARLSDVSSNPAQAHHTNTPNSFDVPDPNSVASTFASSGEKLQLPKSNPDLALTSGTSENEQSGVPPAADDLASSAAQGPSNIGIANAFRTADRQYADDQRKEALSTLSIFYNTPNLSGQERAGLLARLDPLAREVIYSKQHLLEKPYRVGQQETLVDVATKYEVPWQLLANINQVADPMTLLPGTELKVVSGPFRAEVNLSQQELTLFLGDLYAGRFPIAVGSDPAPNPGAFTVQDKQTEHTYYNRAGSPVLPGSEENPYGSVWMDLGGQICIHGSPDSNKPTNNGCISLADHFATDLYGILSQGSSVTIRR